MIEDMGDYLTTSKQLLDIALPFLYSLISNHRSLPYHNGSVEEKCSLCDWGIVSSLFICPPNPGKHYNIKQIITVHL